MPRIARVVAVGYPHHITQRGNNRSRVFFDEEDRRVYLKVLGHYSKEYGAEIWAYCLMDNHIHLLAVPRREDSLARGIGGTNLVYTQHINKKYGRSGRLWQGRFYSCVVDKERYLWAVAKYIEGNPLRAGLVANVEDYRWSSARFHLLGEGGLLKCSDWLQESERGRYRDYIREPDREDLEAIRKATLAERPLGGKGFVRGLEQVLGRELTVRPRGRPRKDG